MRVVYLVVVIFLLSSCTPKEEPKPLLKVTKEPFCTKKISKKILKKEQKSKEESVADLKRVSQDVKSYLSEIEPTYISSQKSYERAFFQVWNREKIETRLSDALWANKAFDVSNSYGENLQKLKSTFFDRILENANYKRLATFNLQAISLKELNIRAFPTEKPLFLDPSKAGEGFPFDYLQNSTVSANKPLLVSHYSKDREWVFIETSFTFGWVKSREIALLNSKYTKLWQKAKQVFIIKDGVPIYAEDGSFLFHSKIGMMLPLIEENEKSYTVLTITKYKNEKPLYTRSKLSKSVAHLGILEFNQKNIAKILTEIAKSHYGWGGLNSQRDCSSTLRDLYAPFGIWLPRNSYQQSKYGKSISLEGLSDDAKIAKIKKEGTPFRTLLYKKGHIVLYVGVVDGEIIIFQNVWGVKTKKENKEGRFVIGRAVFSTLEIGKNLKYFDRDASLLKNLKSMTKL